MGRTKDDAGAASDAGEAREAGAKDASSERSVPNADTGSDARKPAEAGPCAGRGAVAVGFRDSLTLNVDGAQRIYAITVPSDYTNATPYPLVIAFHGDMMTGSSFRGLFPIENAAAIASGPAIFVWPYAGDSGAFLQGVDPPDNADVDFFDAMIAAFESTYCVDDARVFVTGFSSGAFFANQLSRWRSGVVKGDASQSGGAPYGIEPGDTDPNTGGATLAGPVPAIVIVDPMDPILDPGDPLVPVEYFEAADSCGSATSAWTTGPCVQATGCSQPVVSCSIPGLGHAIWPGSAKAIWSFFASLP